MNDRGISSELKEQLEDSFFNRFGIPLNKLISNAKFRAGKADLTDYIMTLSIVEELSSEEEEVLKKLKKRELLMNIQQKIFTVKILNAISTVKKKRNL